MNWKKEWKVLALIGAVFLAFFYLPVGQARFDNAVLEALYLAKWYARTYFLFPLLLSISGSYASPFFHMPYNAANKLLATVNLAL